MALILSAFLTLLPSAPFPSFDYLGRTVMKVPFSLGTVGHFGLAVRNPKKSATWFERAFGLTKQFEFEDGIAVGNDSVTIALHKGKPAPETLGHMSFHLPDMATLRKALKHLKRIKADLEDSGDEDWPAPIRPGSGPSPPGPGRAPVL